MDRDPERYAAMFEDAGIDLESLTVVLVRGGTRAEVLHLLGAEPESSGEPYPNLEDPDFSEYAATEVRGGVVAFEHTGYADPSTRVLPALSQIGGAAAVARDNIMGHQRFGCAQSGSVEFDADEFVYAVETARDRVPSELRAMFDLACDPNLQGPISFHSYAMAARYTGVVVTAGDLERAKAQGYHRVRMATHLEK